MQPPSEFWVSPPNEGLIKWFKIGTHILVNLQVSVYREEEYLFDKVMYVRLSVGPQSSTTILYRNHQYQ